MTPGEGLYGRLETCTHFKENPFFGPFQGNATIFHPGARQSFGFISLLEIQVVPILSQDGRLSKHIMRVAERSKVKEIRQNWLDEQRE